MRRGRYSHGKLSICAHKHTEKNPLPFSSCCRSTRNRFSSCQKKRYLYELYNGGCTAHSDDSLLILPSKTQFLQFSLNFYFVHNSSCAYTISALQLFNFVFEKRSWQTSANTFNLLINEVLLSATHIVHPNHKRKREKKK